MGLQLLLCAIAGVVIVVVVRVERRSLDSIGLHRPNWTSAALALGTALAVMYLLPRLTGPLMTALDLGGFESGLDVVVRMPVWFRVCVALTSGFVEETLYRGYAVERLADMAGRRWLGGVLAIIAFGAAHIPFWGVGPALAADLPFGAVMTGLYLWRAGSARECGRALVAVARQHADGARCHTRHTVSLLPLHRYDGR